MTLPQFWWGNAFQDSLQPMPHFPVEVSVAATAARRTVQVKHTRHNRSALLHHHFTDVRNSSHHFFVRDMDGLVVCAVDRQSSSSGVRILVPPDCRGPFGKAPSGAPFNIPPHHQYRRWMGGVSRRHIFSNIAISFMSAQIMRFSHENHSSTTPATTRSATGAAGRQGAHLLVVCFFCLSGVRTGDSRVAIGYTATALGGQNLIL